MINFNMLRKYFPRSFDVFEVKQLVVAILIYIGIDFVGGFASLLVRIVPFIGGILSWAVGTVCGIYTLAGIILAILSYLKIIE